MAEFPITDKVVENVIYRWLVAPETSFWQLKKRKHKVIKPIIFKSFSFL